MIGEYLKDRQYDIGMGLGRHGDGVIAPNKVKSHDNTFGLGFHPSRHDMKEMKMNKRGHEKSICQIYDLPMQIPHISITFPSPICTY